MEARIADLADRLGLAGPDATERVLKISLDDLDAKAPTSKMERLNMERLDIEAEVAERSGVAKRNRALRPFDDEKPPSRVWQDELYDKRGLPK